MASFRSLLQHREDLRSRIDKLQRELDLVERQLFSRVERVAAVVDGEMSVSATLRPQSSNAVAPSNEMGTSRPVASARDAVGAVRRAPSLPPANEGPPPLPDLAALMAPIDAASAALKSVSLPEWKLPDLKIPEVPSLSSVFSASLALPDFSKTSPLSSLAIFGDPHVRSGEAIREALKPGPRISEAAVEVLRRAGRPMKTGEIYLKLLEMGVAVGGARPKNNLAAHLSNTRSIESSEDGWKLTSEAAAERAGEGRATNA